MPRKSWAIGIVLIGIAGLFAAYFFTDGFYRIPQLDGSTQVKIEKNSSHDVIFNQQVGAYKYFFIYIPSTITSWDHTVTGWLSVWREDVQAATQLTLTINVPQNYNGITITITQVKPEYVICTLKATS